MKQSWNAQFYAANSQIQHEVAAKLLNKDKFNPDDIVLDLGCGDGSLTNTIASWLPKGKVIGVDKSKEMIDHASSTYPHIEFIQHDMNNLNELPGCFDVITAINCIHWIADQRALFKNVKRLLNPQGRFYALSYPRVEPFWTAVDNVIAKPKWQHYFINYQHNCYYKDVAFYQKILLHHAFSKQLVICDSADTTFKNDTTLKDNTATWIPHLGQLPLAEHADFLSDFSFEFKKLSKVEDDGTIHYPCETINIEAVV